MVERVDDWTELNLSEASLMIPSANFKRAGEHLRNDVRGK